MTPPVSSVPHPFSAFVSAEAVLHPDVERKAFTRLAVILLLVTNPCIIAHTRSRSTPERQIAKAKEARFRHIRLAPPYRQRRILGPMTPLTRSSAQLDHFLAAAWRPSGLQASYH